ncbi:cytochrome c [Myroides odoratimimus]|uniref:cytochrome c n=1 Tax=Myroides odoratimimus TaxID=76832 RepID=UPI003100C0A4
MDFPLFHLDWLNDRFLIAMIAIIHVFINHGLAVGFIPYITLLEQQGVVKSSPNDITDLAWDKMVQRMMMVGFVITTTVGAMTGVGIWFSAALISPNSIGSLIRVFYWGWFTEWIVFVLEVIFIMIYFLTWKNSNKSLRAKQRHIRFGWFLSGFSWLTMAIIVAILGFMMDPGNWIEEHSFISALTNPIYLPQLLFRTPTAMIVAGAFGFLLIMLFTKKGSLIRKPALKTTAIWVLLWLPLSILAAIYYYNVIPEAMTANMSTAVGTMDFEKYYNLLKYIILIATSSLALLAIWVLIKPKKVNLVMVIIPFILSLGFLGIFERVREFIRKPYVIGNYMYSNLIREEDYPLLQRDGILKHSTYTSITEITEENKLEAGRDIFMIACSRCHTSQGINSIIFVFEKMYGKGKPLDINSMKAYIPNMHNGRTYMPPYPGNEEELDALAHYIFYLQQSGATLEGAQSAGTQVNPNHSVGKFIEDKLNNINHE